MSLPPLPPAVAEALRRDRVLEAVRLLRQQPGVGLKEAREWVEQHRRQAAAQGAAAAPDAAGPPGLDEWLKALFAAGSDGRPLRRLVQEVLGEPGAPAARRPPSGTAPGPGSASRGASSAAAGRSGPEGLPGLPPGATARPAPVVRTSLAPFTPEQVRRGTRLSPGEQPRPRGGGAVAVIVGLLLVAAGWWFA